MFSIHTQLVDLVPSYLDMVQGILPTVVFTWLFTTVYLRFVRVGKTAGGLTIQSYKDYEPTKLERGEMGRSMFV